MLPNRLHRARIRKRNRESPTLKESKVFDLSNRAASRLLRSPVPMTGSMNPLLSRIIGLRLLRGYVWIERFVESYVCCVERPAWRFLPVYMTTHPLSSIHDDLLFSLYRWRLGLSIETSFQKWRYWWREYLVESVLYSLHIESILYILDLSLIDLQYLADRFFLRRGI